MSNNRENLENIVSKLKEQGINAGEEEKQRIIESAKKQAEEIISKAKLQSEEIIEDANKKATQVEKNTQTALSQASRDMVEATKIAMLQHLKSVFGDECKSLFTQEQYLKEITKAVVDSISGKKSVLVSPEMLKEMENYLLNKAMSEQIDLKPLNEIDSKIVVNSSEKEGVQLVLSAQDVEVGLFSLLNKDLVNRITQQQED